MGVSRTALIVVVVLTAGLGIAYLSVGRFTGNAVRPSATGGPLTMAREVRLDGGSTEAAAKVAVLVRDAAEAGGVPEADRAGVVAASDAALALLARGAVEAFEAIRDSARGVEWDDEMVRARATQRGVAAGAGTGPADLFARAASVDGVLPGRLVGIDPTSVRVELPLGELTMSVGQTANQIAMPVRPDGAFLEEASEGACVRYRARTTSGSVVDVLVKLMPAPGVNGGRVWVPTSVSYLGPSDGRHPFPPL